MSAGRPLQYDPAAAMDAATQTFWCRGYEGTSMQDLLSATGLSKSSFYQAFGSKHGALQQAIEHYCDSLTVRLRQRLMAAESGWAFIEGVLLAAADEARSQEDPRGCLIVNVAMEFSGRDPVIGRLISGGVKRVTRIFIAAIKRAQREGSIPKEKDASVLGRYLLASLSGLRAMVKAGSSHAAVTEIAAVIMTALK